MPVSVQGTSLAQGRRYLINRQVDELACYEPIIQPFLPALSGRTILLLLDTTAAGLNCHLLTIAVAYHRRALPVAWRSGRRVRGHTAGETPAELLQQIAGYLSSAADVILMGDGEFGNVTLLTWLEAQNWRYCLRVASDTYLYIEDDWQRIDSFDLKLGEIIWLPNVYLTQAHPFGPVNLLLLWGEKNQRLLPLVTNLPLPEEAQYWYRHQV